MYLLTPSKKRIQLTRMPTEVVEDTATRSLTVAVNASPKRDPSNASALVARASRAFFEIGQPQVEKALPARAANEAAPQGPPPVAFRESTTGLIRLVYRELVIRFAPGLSERKRNVILAQRGFKVRRVNPYIQDQVIVYHPERKYGGEDLVETANQWTEMDEVVFASPNFVTQFRRSALPSIPAASWHLHNLGKDGARAGEDVNIQAAWKITQGSPKIIVAVLDDGVDIAHPGLKTRIWKNPDKSSPDKYGRDFYVPEDAPDYYDPRPKEFRYPYDQMVGNDIHGTCCAGVVVATGGKGGAIGAAPKCRLLPIKIFHADALAAEEAVANAIRYAGRIADVLSCSWTGGESSDIRLALEDVARTGRNGRGCPVLCAAGNDSGRPVGYPAADANAIAVGASTDKGERASYSNVGPELAFVAPSSGGVKGIYSTDVSYDNRGFNIGSVAQGGKDGLYFNGFGGTSSATPLAAGIAALVLSANPELNSTAVRELMTSTADKIGSGYEANGHSREFGFGRVNAGKAVAAAKAAKKQMPNK